MMESLFKALRPTFRALGDSMQSAGRSLDAIGTKLQGSRAHVEKLVPSTRFVEVEGKVPTIADDVFVASNASILGDVKVSKNAGVWYGALVRSSGSKGTTIGSNSHVLDNATIDAGSKIGNNVLVDANCVVQGSELQDGCSLGLGVIVGPGSVIGEGAAVENGSLVPPGTTIPAGEVWGGNPSQFKRKLAAPEATFRSNRIVDLTNQLALHEGERRKPFEVQRDEMEADQEADLCDIPLHEQADIVHSHPLTRADRPGVIFAQDEDSSKVTLDPFQEENRVDPLGQFSDKYGDLTSGLMEKRVDAAPKLQAPEESK